MDSYALPVDPNHRAFGREYCPMCGSANTADESSDHHSAGDAMRIIARLAVDDPKAVLALLYKIARPYASVRDIANSTRCSKTEIADALNRIAFTHPDLARAAGLKSAVAIARQSRQTKQLEFDIN